MNREEKANIVDDLSGKFAKAKIAIVTDYRGLTVAAFQEVRRELKKNNSEIRVAKNTLFRKAVKGTSFESMDSYLTGTTAVAVSYDDPIASAKILVEFIKNNQKLEIKGAIFNGKALTQEELVALSKLPSREILLSKLLSVMQAVPTNFVQVLSGVPRKMLYLLQSIKNQKEQ